jgi:methionine-rich copper-binding protein CopC
MTMRVPKLRTAIVAALLVLVASGVAATQVFAHSRPLRFDPPPGIVLQAAPSQIKGWFGSDIRRDPNWSFIQVTDAQGQRVDAGDVALSSDRLQMTANLKSGLGPGAYLVSWRTWDDGDGEIFGDCYVFYVGQAAADAAVASKTRLDGGSKCPRIEIAAKDGTPTPSQLSKALTPVAEDDAGSADSAHTGDSSSGSGKLLIGLIIGLIGGGAAGVLGGRLIGGHA